MGTPDSDDADQAASNIQIKTPGLWQRYRALPRNVFAIGVVSLLNDASSEIIYPLLPVFLSLTLGASPAVIGLIEGDFNVRGNIKTTVRASYRRQ